MGRADVVIFVQDSVQDPERFLRFNALLQHRFGHWFTDCRQDVFSENISTAGESEI